MQTRVLAAFFGRSRSR